MLFTRMDLLNSQFLDKMNNNIGRLHYEGESRMPSMPTSMTSMRAGPPPVCPSKRKYGGEDPVDERIDCDNDHMTKMSRLFAAQLVRPAGGDHRSDPWSLGGHSPAERHVSSSSSSSNGLHGNHLYASVPPSYGMEQPLALTKAAHERAAMPGPAERQQNRPSVITCAPASNRNCSLSHCHKNDCSPSPPMDQRKANANTAIDPVIEEHFRRSLGKNYKEPEPVSNSVSITGSVDDHFAKALGETWLQIKAKGGGPPSPDAHS